MATILDPQPGQSVYDSNCGTAGLLIKAHLRLIDKFGVKGNGSKKLPPKVAPLKLFGQEINPSTFAMARMNAFIHDMEAEIALGDTMTNPRFTQRDGSLRRFDRVTANPMWNQKFAASLYENDTWGRFARGVPPTSSADWGWIQHMHASLADTGKLAVVLDTGAVSRGSGNQGSNKERDIRKAFVEADLIEAVVLLPENLFYNTTAPGIILVLNRRKPHPGQILLINGSKQFSKGWPKNYLEQAHVAAIANAYLNWQAVDSLSAVITTADAAKNDFNLSPSRYVSVGEQAEVLPLDEAVVELREAGGTGNRQPRTGEGAQETGAGRMKTRSRKAAETQPEELDFASSRLGASALNTLAPAPALKEQNAIARGKAVGSASPEPPSPERAEEGELPAGWRWSALSEVVLKAKQTNPLAEPEREFTYVDVSSICRDSLAIRYTNRMLGRDAPSRARKLIRAGDVIFATVRPL